MAPVGVLDLGAGAIAGAVFTGDPAGGGGLGGVLTAITLIETALTSEASRPAKHTLATGQKSLCNMKVNRSSIGLISLKGRSATWPGHPFEQVAMRPHAQQN